MFLLSKVLHPIITRIVWIDRSHWLNLYDSAFGKFIHLRRDRCCSVRSSSLWRITEIQDPWGSFWRVSLLSVDLWLSPTELGKAWKIKNQKDSKHVIPVPLFFHGLPNVRGVSWSIIISFVRWCMMIRILKVSISYRNLGMGGCALSLIVSISKIKVKVFWSHNDCISMYFRGTWITLWMTCSRQQQRWLDHWWVERPALTSK